MGSKPISKDKQVEAAARALTIIKALILEHAPGVNTAWTAEEWSKAMWALLEPATSHRLAVQSCPEVFGTSELWKSAVALALAKISDHDTEVDSAAWPPRWRVGMTLTFLAGLMCKVPQRVEATAKAKCAVAVTSLVVVGVSVWFSLRGPVYLVRRRTQDEKISAVKVLAKKLPKQL